MQHPLDDPIWSALSGPNARFAIGFGKALHFQRDVAPFSAISEPSDEAYADLAVQLPAGGLARMFRPAMEPLPVGWEHVEDFSLLQMVAVPQVLKRATGSSEISVLKAQDLPEMLELVSLTQPGPFEERTPELGLYLGIRQGGRLIAMAGERMRVPGYVGCKKGVSPRSKAPCMSRRKSNAARPRPRACGRVQIALSSTYPGTRMRSPAIAVRQPPCRMPT